MVLMESFPGSAHDTTHRQRWRDAGAVLAVVVTLILTARQLRPLVEAAAFVPLTGDALATVPVSAWFRAGAWVAVSVAVLLRWRVLAVLGAWAGVLFEAIIAARRMNNYPGDVVPVDVLMWSLILAITAALLLSVSAPVDRGLELLGRRGYWLLMLTVAVTALSAAAVPVLGERYGPPHADSIGDGAYPIFGISSNLARSVAGATFAVVPALAVATVRMTDRAVRFRGYVLMAVGTAGFIVMQLGLPLPFGVFPAPVLSFPTQPVILLVASGLIGWAGLRWTRLTERSKAWP